MTIDIYGALTVYQVLFQVLFIFCPCHLVRTPCPWMVVERYFWNHLQENDRLGLRTQAGVREGRQQNAESREVQNNEYWMSLGWRSRAVLQIKTQLYAEAKQIADESQQTRCGRQGSLDTAAQVKHTGLCKQSVTHCQDSASPAIPFSPMRPLDTIVPI